MSILSEENHVVIKWRWFFIMTSTFVMDVVWVMVVKMHQNILAIMKMVTKFKRRVFIKKTCRIHEVIFKIKIYIMKSTKEMANSSNIWRDWQDVIQSKNRERIISIIYIFRKICKLLRVGNYNSIELSKNKYINN